MNVYCLPPPARVEAAAKTVADWIKGQEAAAGLDDAMRIVRDWLRDNEDRRRRLNEIRILPHEH
jgi:hypothetical protein